MLVAFNPYVAMLFTLACSHLLSQLLSIRNVFNEFRGLIKRSGDHQSSQHYDTCPRPILGVKPTG